MVRTMASSVRLYPALPLQRNGNHMIFRAEPFSPGIDCIFPTKQEEGHTGWFAERAAGAATRQGHGRCSGSESFLQWDLRGARQRGSACPGTPDRGSRACGKACLNFKRTGLTSACRHQKVSELEAAEIPAQQRSAPERR